MGGGNLRKIERKIIENRYIKNLYSRSGEIKGEKRSASDDVIGSIKIEYEIEIITIEESVKFEVTKDYLSKNGFKNEEELFNFAVVEQQPIYPGCSESASKDENYICFLLNVTLYST